MIKSSISVFLLISIFMVASCDQPLNSTEEKYNDSSTATVVKNDTTPLPVYNPALDPSLIGAAFSKKLDDSLGINIYEVTLKPGDSIPFHSHPDHAIYLMDTGTAVLYEPGKDKGEVLPAIPPATGWVMGPIDDAVKNIGKTSIRWLEIDVHRPNSIEMPAKPAYDASIDRFNMGGKSIQKIADSMGIKMFTVTMKPGDTAALHSHPDYAVYVLEGGEMAVTPRGGTPKRIKLERGKGLVIGPSIHTEKNTGKTTIKLLLTHIYRPRIK
jgi:quercetin dioxygenase-like cupin family protein